jgi:hypothetical protein
MAKLTNPEPLSQEANRELERIRAAHRLRALTDTESGSGVNRLPNGVYGFTYSPAEDDFPLFNDRDLRSFEGHKLEDGGIFLLGFLTSEEKAAFEKPEAETAIHLFPEPRGSADQLVRVPLARVARHAENSARKGTGLELFLKRS